VDSRERNLFQLVNNQKPSVFNCFQTALLIVIFALLSFVFTPYTPLPVLSLHAALTLLFGLLAFGKLSILFGLILGWSSSFVLIGLIGGGNITPTLLVDALLGMITFAPHYLAGGVIAQLNNLNPKRFLHKMRNLGIALITDLFLVGLTVIFVMKIAESVLGRDIKGVSAYLELILLHVTTILIALPFLYTVLVRDLAKPTRYTSFTNQKESIVKAVQGAVAGIFVCVVLREFSPFSDTLNDIIGIAIISAVMLLHSTILNPKSVTCVSVGMLFFVHFYQFSPINPFSNLSQVESFAALQVFSGLLAWFALTLSIYMGRFKRFADANALQKARLIEHKKNQNEKLLQSNRELFKSYSKLKSAKRELEDIAHWDSSSLLPNRNKARPQMADYLKSQVQFHSVLVSLENYRDYYIDYSHEFVEDCMRELGLVISRQFSGRMFEDGQEWLYRWSTDKLLLILKNIEQSETEAISKEIVSLCREGIKVRGLLVRLYSTVAADISKGRITSNDIVDNLYQALKQGRESSVSFGWYKGDTNRKMGTHASAQIRLGDLIESDDVLPVVKRFRKVGRDTHYVFRISDRDFVTEQNLSYSRELFVASAVKWSLLEVFEKNIIYKKLIFATEQTANDPEAYSVVGVSVSILQSELLLLCLVEYARRSETCTNRIIIELQCIDVEFDNSTLRESVEKIKLLGYRLSLNVQGQGDSFLRAILTMPLDFFVVGRLVEQFQFDKVRTKGLIHSLAQLTNEIGCEIIVYNVTNNELISVLEAVGVEYFYEENNL